MSYILDALKRSELQRNATRIPTVAAPLGVLVESAQPGRVRWIVAAVVLVAAIATGLAWWFGWLTFRHVAPSASVPAAGPAPSPVSAERPAVAPARVTQVAEQSDSLPKLKLAETIPQRRSEPGPVTTGAPKDKAASAKADLRGQENAATPLPIPEKAGGAATVAYGDLPAAVRQILPKLAINGFASGDGGAAMVIVDDKLLHEGDEVAPGVRIERILPDGVEFSYKGYRFRR